jgi:NAD-dependent SIR2 family protein deacetylase
MTHSPAESLRAFLDEAGAVAVVTGAGVSTPSGIPDYRDRNGDWKIRQPIQFGEFRGSEAARRRYWARSYVGWQRFSGAAPNVAHRALVDLEADGKLDTLITQNVDGLHRAAGSRRIIDLHGDLARVRCLDCGDVRTRSEYQTRLREANPGWHAEVFRYRPDGDAELAERSCDDFAVPPCDVCGGPVKPDVVMFGEAVPRDRVDAAMIAVDRADALLVVGSSLMVFSGFRFARRAAETGKPIAIVNRGRTRADDIATLKIDADCADLLPAALRASAA